MAITVKAYTKQENLVTVHGYTPQRNAANELNTIDRPVVTRQLVFRGAPMGISPPGLIMNPMDAPPQAGEGGKTAYMAQPGGYLASPAYVRWRRSILPLKGAYAIPKGTPQ